jgi:hypothetical protein
MGTIAMTDRTGAAAPNQDLPAELVELGELIARLPGSEGRKIASAYADVADCFRRRRRILSLVQEALSQLRLDVKYLLFDLEVTRRERDELRAQLEDARRDDFESF